MTGACSCRETAARVCDEWAATFDENLLTNPFHNGSMSAAVNIGKTIRALPCRCVPAGSVVVPGEPTPADWGAIQAMVGDDCAVSIVADIAQKECTWEQGADRICAYAIAAWKQAMLAASQKVPHE